MPTGPVWKSICPLSYSFPKSMKLYWKWSSAELNTISSDQSNQHIKRTFKETISWLKVISLTLYDETTSSMGLNLWLSCFCELTHTKHTGCLSSRQKSLSFSLCKLQISSDPDERLSFLSFRNDSHKFLNARLRGGTSFEDLLLQTGHSWVFLVLQNCWRHSLQKLWLHDKITGFLKISWHTGQDKSSSGSEAISTLSAPAI